MGAEVSLEEVAQPPALSNEAALDACRGQLGRGQLIDTHGSSLWHDAQWRQQVDALFMACDDETLCQPLPADAPAFDMDARLADARAALQDSRVADARYRLVPLRLSERQFWRAVFWRVERAHMRLDAEGCLSPVPRLHTTISGKSLHANERRPLAARVNDTLGWAGKAGSPGDCKRGELYSPNGTSLHGYDEFGC
jgi:hypothetical protein